MNKDAVPFTCKTILSCNFYKYYSDISITWSNFIFKISYKKSLHSQPILLGDIKIENYYNSSLH